MRKVKKKLNSYPDDASDHFLSAKRLSYEAGPRTCQAQLSRGGVGLGVDTPGKMPRVARARTRTRPGLPFGAPGPAGPGATFWVHPARFVPLLRTEIFHHRDATRASTSKIHAAP